MKDFKEYVVKLTGIKKWLEKEFSSIRTGRATVTLLDGVFVDAYGSRLPLNQVSTISIEDPRTLKINPFDQSQAKNIEKSISEADLGVSVLVNSSGLRVIFPELTSERRELLIKQAKKKTEEAKISVRAERERVLKDIQTQQKNKEISEDDRDTLKEELEKITGEVQKEFDKILKEKEEEIKI